MRWRDIEREWVGAWWLGSEKERGWNLRR